ncbi:hypothetical protein [Pseudomonas coronafaciens]|uniref:phosphoribosyltransferase-like protein n=1 Tax=Pseudomonas coronafaciens TaxID=53409 RepID=UPI0006B570F1|nr:hypothetical protein [Pseudomonas coronafaciens]
MDTKENFNTILNLIARQPWIGDKTSELSHVLYEECKCSNSREMLIKILDNFSYLSTQDYSEKMNSLADEIMSDAGYEDNALIVAMAGNSGPDSSQELLYNLKYIFTKKGWNSFCGVNTFGAALKNFNRTKRRKIYVIDDFVGSGQTVIGRHKELTRVFTNAEVADFSITFKVLVSTLHGLEAIAEAGIEISAQLIIKKAIDGYFSEEVAADYRSLMGTLESALLQNYEGIALPNLGYNGAQAAYCREDANTPNSVFPIFWWPFYSDSKKRNTMLHRAMRDA